MIDRRGFSRMLVGGILLAPLNARAQSASRIRRIGVLVPSQAPTQDVFQELLAPLRELGWTEGKNLAIESRSADGARDRLRPLADELVRLRVEIIVTYGTPATLAAKSASTSIPIVMGSAADPVGVGLVASLARPGGNITGYSIVGTEMVAKRAGLVHELLPAARRVAVIVAPKGFSKLSDLVRSEADAAYRSLGVQPILLEILPTRSDFESALSEAVREAVRRQAQVLDLQDGNVEALTEATTVHHLPVIVQNREMLEAGGLLSFGINDEDRLRRVAAIVDKILRGAKPADIPVEQPTRYELGINLKAAKALGITVPQSLLVRADEVIR